MKLDAMSFKRIYILLTLLVATVTGTFAQTVRLQAPSACEKGARITVSYIVDTNDVKDIHVGEFTGFDVLYGPATSTSQSFSMLNGKTTQSASTTFTYTLLAKEEGEHRLPAARVQVGSKSISSSTATINVLPASTTHSSSNQSSQSSQQRQSQSRSYNGSIDSDDLFITATLSKTRVFKQEAVLLTYKLYTLVNVRQLSNEMPQLDGFHCQELENKSQHSLKYERYKGRNYGTTVWRQYVLFPQKSGQLTIPSISFDAEVEVVNASSDPFDIFFGGGSLTQLVRKTINAPALELTVNPLPTPYPPDFSDAVGQFSLKATLTPEQVNANDAATLRLVLTGVGNMQLIKTPQVDVPKDFEVYTPKETPKTAITSSGLKGNVTWDYVMVPRHGGGYTIPPVNFTYFDPSTAKYVTLSTDSFHLAVAKGQELIRTTTREQEDLRVISSDIHYINTRPADIRDSVDDFFATMSYWMSYLLMTVVFLLLLLIFYRQAKANADLAGKRAGRAGKEAAKRLKKARKLMQQHQPASFYEETLRALLGYAGDKLGLPMSSLSKENVRQAMTTKGVPEPLIQEYMDVLESCEFARFAPGDPEKTMDTIYDSAARAISSLNKSM